MKPFTRTLAAMALAVGLASGAQAQDRLSFKAIGQPLATGLIQKNKEQPFFEQFAAALKYVIFSASSQAIIALFQGFAAVLRCAVDNLSQVAVG